MFFFFLEVYFERSSFLCVTLAFDLVRLPFLMNLKLETKVKEKQAFAPHTACVCAAACA